jgi:outer membrane protein, heavy metal efflux system
MRAWRQLPMFLLTVVMIVGCGRVPPGSPSLRPILEPRNLPAQAWEDHAPSDVEETTRQLLDAPLGIDDALRVALLNHPALRANLRTLDARRAQAMEAVVLENPEVSTHVLFGADDLKVEAEVELSLTPLLQRSIRMERVRAETETSRIEAANFVLDFTYELHAAYYEHVADAERLRLQRKLLSVAEGAANTAEILYEAGNITGLELVTHQAFASETRHQLFAAEAAYVSSRKRLHRMMGLNARPHQSQWEVLEALPPLPQDFGTLDELTRAASENSLALALERRRMNLNQSLSRLDRQVRWLPHLGIGVAAEYEDDEWKVGPALTLGLPMFDRRRHSVDALRAEELAMAARMEGHHRRVHALAVEVHERLRLAHQTVRHFEDELLPLRRRVVEEALLQYNAMELSVFELLRVRQEEIRAERARHDALREFWLTHARQDYLRAGGALD